jgi:hypothetical protein
LVDNTPKLCYSKCMDISRNIDFWHHLGEAFGAKSVWSMYEEAGFAPDDVGIHGKGLTLVYSEHWAFEGTQSISLPDNPTWLQLYVAADTLIRRSGDTHHIYIEQFTQDAKNPNVSRLTTGS